MIKIWNLHAKALKNLINWQANGRIWNKLLHTCIRIYMIPLNQKLKQSVLSVKVWFGTSQAWLKFGMSLFGTSKPLKI